MNSLRRNRNDRVFSGVCSGLARYIAIDVTWIRVAFVLLALASGLGTALYIILALLIPLEEDDGQPANQILQANFQDLAETAEEKVNQLYDATGQNRVIAAGLIVLGGMLLFAQIGWLNFGWVIGVGTLLLGGFLLARRKNK